MFIEKWPTGISGNARRAQNEMFQKDTIQQKEGKSVFFTKESDGCPQNDEHRQLNTKGEKGRNIPVKIELGMPWQTRFVMAVWFVIRVKCAAFTRKLTTTTIVARSLCDGFALSITANTLTGRK